MDTVSTPLWPVQPYVNVGVEPKPTGWRYLLEQPELRREKVLEIQHAP